MLRLTPRPRFIVVGERSGGLVRGRVVNESAVALDFAVTNRRFEWPDDMPPLAAGLYRLELAPATGADVRTFPVEIVDEKAGPALVVLRAE